MNGLISRLIYPGASRPADVGQVERTLQPGEELVWQETTCGERIGLVIRPPAGQQRWIVGAADLTADDGRVRRLAQIAARHADDNHTDIETALATQGIGRG